jgi:hypothetical protein
MAKPGDDRDPSVMPCRWKSLPFAHSGEWLTGCLEREDSRHPHRFLERNLQMASRQLSGLNRASKWGQGKRRLVDLLSSGVIWD